MSERGIPDKEEWLRHAVEAYDKVFGERDRLGPSRVPMTFSDIEAEAVREGNKLARWLLEGKISGEAALLGSHAEECSCPFCGKPAKRRREEPVTREVQARPGAVSFERYQYYCSRCRRAFFPSGPQAEPEN